MQSRAWASGCMRPSGDPGVLRVEEEGDMAFLLADLTHPGPALL